MESHPAYPRAAQDAVTHFRPLITVIAAIAHGDNSRRDEIEFLLPQLDNNGWTIAEATYRIWHGERSFEALTDGLDANSAAVIHAILDAVDTYQSDAETERISGLVSEWRPIILTVGAAALGIGQAADDIDGFLPQLEAQDQWKTLAHRIRLLLAGDHNRERLLADLDPTDTILMSAILHTLEDREQLMALLRAERSHD